MNNADHLVVWQNTTEWGGIDVLALRLSNYLLERQIPHRVVHREGTRQWQNLPESVRCSLDEIATLSERTHTVLLPTISMLRDREAIAASFPHANVVCWIAHPLDVITSLFPFAARVLPYLGLPLAAHLKRLLPRHHALVQGVLGRLMEGGGLIFMDAATRRQFDLVFPGLRHHPAPLIPIPSPTPDHLSGAPVQSTTLRIGYLGRMDRMKWFALEPFISQVLAAEVPTRPVRLLAITEGVLVGELVATCLQHGIEIDRRTYLPNEEARALLCTETDLVVAMGTSALDIAACGHPVLVIDPAYRRGAAPQRLFRFMHEAEGFTLGEYRDSLAYVPGLRSFPECLAQASSATLREASAEYVRRHHAPETVFSRLLDVSRTSRIAFEDLRRGMEEIDRSFRRISPRYFFSRLNGSRRLQPARISS